MKIKFMGAAGTVTGSAFLLDDGSQKILVDFGMFQGPPEVSELNYVPLSFNPSEVSAVVLTHAHLDHCGRLPVLCKNGFNGKVYMTLPTKELVDLSLHDAAAVALKNGGKVLYTLEDVENLVNLVESVKYKEAVQVGNYTLTFRDAGHILGSASVEIVNNGKKIVFSGDLGNTPEDIIQPTDFVDQADFVVMESTYGDSLHSTEDISQVIKEEINIVELTTGVLMIPAFSLERTQELLHRIHHLKKNGSIKKETMVFLDSPLGIRATEIFEVFRDYYNDEMRAHTDDPFRFPGLYVTEQGRDSRKIRKMKGTKVIIAGSGMMTGGRILHHAKDYLPRSNTRILFVGYQAEDTMGRKILEGAKQVELDDKVIKVNAKIREIDSMSSHADQAKLLNWVGHIQGIKKLFLVHGEISQRQTFAEKVRTDIRIEDITLPEKDQEVEV